MREHSPWTRKRARRAAGTRVSRAEELADVTFVLPDDLLLLLVRWHHHAHPPTKLELSMMASRLQIILITATHTKTHT